MIRIPVTVLFGVLLLTVAGCCGNRESERSPTAGEQRLLDEIEAVATGDMELGGRVEQIHALAEKLALEGFYHQVDFIEIPVRLVDGPSRVIALMSKEVARNNRTWLFVPSTSDDFRRIEAQAEGVRAYELQGYFSRQELRAVAAMLRSIYPAWKGRLVIHRTLLDPLTTKDALKRRDAEKAGPEKAGRSIVVNGLVRGDRT